MSVYSGDSMSTFEFLQNMGRLLLVLTDSSLSSLKVISDSFLLKQLKSEEVRELVAVFFLFVLVFLVVFLLKVSCMYFSFSSIYDKRTICWCCWQAERCSMIELRL